MTIPGTNHDTRDGDATQTSGPSRGAKPLAGQVAWVTGAARGIGAATARRLAHDGAHVLLSDRDDPGLVVDGIRRSGGSADARIADVTDRSGCRRLAEDLREQLGRLDVLVCNAGVCPRGEVTGNETQWRRVMDVNLDGTRNCIDAAWDLLAESGNGRLVLVSSMAYYQGGLIVGTEYSASKAALIGMTRHLARNGGPLGLRVNAVAPGIIETDMTADFEAPDLARIPLRRLGCADDVAGPIAFLCGPDSAYMTGTVLNITGGMILAA
ncbi:MAG: SDR family NAD(P)-dependent oxidoreductase [Xanthomonadales bacterium]|jgi:3-oxoacyl-[acyl-carrier protein] reductase|nr:SDR family NAD(P)-dependent oxidoreductase [Xanthomonadales bacterium]